MKDPDGIMQSFLEARGKNMSLTCCDNAISTKWQFHQIEALYNLPMIDLLFQAQKTHREHFNPNQIQASTLLSIKTGTCPEDCAYCPQSGH